MININLVAPIFLSKYLYSHLVKTKKSGIIVNINSLAGKYPNYLESIYCASKFGLCGFGSALSMNQKNSNIKIIDCYIGAMKTPMTQERNNHNELMSPEKISKCVFDLILTENYVSSIDLRNTK